MMLILWFMSGKAVAKVTGLATFLKVMSIGPQVESAFASWIAARNVQAPPAVAQVRSPRLASLASPFSLTVKTVGQGGGGVTSVKPVMFMNPVAPTNVPAPVDLLIR